MADSMRPAQSGAPADVLPIPARPRLGAAQLLRSERAALLLALIVLILLLTALAPTKFLRPVNMLNIILAVSVTGLAAIAETTVMISGGLDVSISALVGLSSVVAAIAVRSTDSWVAGVAAGMLAGLLAGALNGALVTVGRINAVITTLATVSVFAGLAYLATNGQAIGVSNDTFNTIGNGRVVGIPVPVIILVVVFAAMAVFLARTDIGRNLYAMGGNPVAARLAGINLDKYRMGVYMLSGLICGLAAIISTGRTNSGIPTTTQTDLNFQAITAAVLGGTALAGGKGTLSGTVLGVLIIGTLNNGMVILGVPIFYQMLARGVLLISAVLLQTRQASH